MNDRDRELRAVLREPHDEARAHANWDAIERRRARAHVPAAGFPWRVALGAGALAAAAAIAMSLGGRETESVAPAPGPLAIAGGAAIEGVIDPRAIAFEDGSRITIEDGARLEMLENGGDRIRFWLREGSARFAVVPGGPRRWVIESGLVTVEVLGTEFTVDHRDGHVRVSVARGTVLVRGTTVPEGLRRLRAGDAIEVPAQALAVAPRSEIAPAIEALDEPGAPHEPREPAPEPRRRAIAIAEADSTELDEPAIERAPAPGPEPVEAPAPGPERVEAPAPAIDRRLREADALRAEGRLLEAIALLDAVASDPSAGSARALAAFTIGRIEIDRRGHPRAGAVAFARAIELGLAPSLIEDARARRVEALARVPDPEGARDAAAQYLAHHPNGRWAAQVRRWAASP